MKELIARLEKEHAELYAKFRKLDAFLDNPEEAVAKVGTVQVHLLHTELSVMVLYLHVLEARLEDLNNREKEREKDKEKKEETHEGQKRADMPREKKGDRRPASGPELLQVLVDAFNKTFDGDLKIRLCKFGLDDCQ